MKNAFRAALLMLGAMVLYGLIVFYMAVQTQAWQLYTHASGMAVGALLTAAGAAMIRRARSNLGLGLVLVGLYLAGLSATLTVVNLGQVIGFNMIYLTLALAGLTLSQKSSGWVIGVGVVNGLANLLLEFYAPLPYRLEVPNLPTGAWVISGILALLYVGFIVRQFRDYSLRAKLIMAFVLVTLISVGTLTFIITRVIQTELTQQVGANLKEAANSQANVIGDTIASQLDIFSALSVRRSVIDKVNLSNVGYRGDATTIQAEIDRLDQQWRAADAAKNDADLLVQSRLNNLLASELRSLRELAPAHIEIFVTDQYGANVAATNRTTDYYQGDETWWQAAYNHGQGAIYIGQPEFDESKQAFAIVIGIPIHNGVGGPVIGVLRTTYDITALMEQLAATRGQTGHADILLPDTRILNSGGQIVPIEPDTLAQLETIKAVSYAQLTYGGEARLITLTPVTTHDLAKQALIAKLNWQLIANQDLTEALLPVESTVQIGLLAGVGAVLLAGLLAVGIAQALARPITRLTTAAIQIASGDLKAQAPVDSADEIGQLARAFNGMTAQLRELIGSLEERVVERTERLKLVAALGDQLSAILDFDQLLLELVNRVKETFDYYHAHVYIIDTDRQSLVMMAGSGEAGAEMKARGHIIPLNAPSSLVARATRTGEIVTVDDVRQAEDWLPNPLLPDTYAEMAVPIMVDGQVVGVLDVQEDRVGGLDEGDASLLHSLANHVAVALNNARSFEETIQAKEEAELARAEAEKIREEAENARTEAEQAKIAAERTKEEAEAANKAMEVKIWQTTGQAQLSAIMRGEQDIRTLASSIIQQVCHYLQVQTGVLYLAKGQYLKPMGRYAYSQIKPTDRFKFGEDFVGQAALEKRRLFIKNIPEGYLTVRSGLGKRAPKNIMLFPFIHNDRVVGVIELGTLHDFSQAQLEFIETALDSIAIAFNTAQDRTRIDELLNQTRQQADDLQAQEEKLRGINEQLEVHTDNGSPRQR